MTSERKTTSTQTAVHSFSSTGVQTKADHKVRAPSIVESLLLTEVRRDETNDLLADEVVEYDDTNAEDLFEADNCSNASYEFVPFGGTAVSLPKQSPKHDSQEKIEQLDVAASGATSEAWQRVRQLERELEEVRSASILRERELTGIVEICRESLKTEVDRDLQKSKEVYLKEIETLQRSLQQSKDILSKRDEMIKEKSSLLAMQEELVDDAARNRDKHWKLVEGELHSEISRLRMEKEKIRFESEALRNRSECTLLATTTLQQRVHEAESLWHQETRRRLLAEEEATRCLIAHHSDEQRILLENFLHLGCVAHSFHEAKLEATWNRMRTLLEVALLTDAEHGLAQLDAQGVAVNDPVERGIRALIVERATNWKLTEQAIAKDNLARDEQLALLRAGVVDWNNQVAEIVKATERKVGLLTERCQTAETVVGKMSKKVGDNAGSRASARAANDVIEQLVMDHSNELSALHGELQRLREKLDVAQRTNKIDEALALQGKLTVTERQCATLQAENKLIKSKCASLESACRAMEEGTTQQTAAIHSRETELDRLRVQLEETVGQAAAVQHRLNTRVVELEKDARRLSGIVAERDDQEALLRKKIELLASQNESLKEKFVKEKTEEVVARVNRRLTTDSSVSGFSRRDDAEIEKLQQKVLVLRRENDALAHRLDTALAEASHAEEHRRQTIERNLAMMASEDSAQKREISLMQTKFELNELRKKLEERDAALVLRANELERRESQLNRLGRGQGKLTPSLVAMDPPSGSSTQRSTSSQDAQLLSVAAAAAPKSGSQVKLAPLTLRQFPSSLNSTVPHPQKFSLPS